MDPVHGHCCLDVSRFQVHREVHSLRRPLKGVQGLKRTVRQKLLAHALLISFSGVFILPFLWLVSTSFKPDVEIFREGLDLIPDEATFAHYIKGVESFSFFLFLKNSLVICFLTVIGSILSCSLAAYGFSLVEWRGRDTCFYFLLATMMLPPQVTMVPVFMIFRQLGWINTILPLVVPFFLGNAFFIFLLRQFFLSIPRDLIDAARIDGCHELRIWAMIVLPLSRPALATVGLFAFLYAWNDFLGPLIYLMDESKYTLSLGLAMLRGQYLSDWGALMAVSTLMVIPIIILFFFTQKTFIQGINTTGLNE
jgi:multiple sugar transport system permease protein